MRQFRVLPLVILTASLVACGGGGGGVGQGGANGPTLGSGCNKAGEQTGIDAELGDDDLVASGQTAGRRLDPRYGPQHE